MNGDPLLMPWNMEGRRTLMYMIHQHLEKGRSLPFRLMHHPFLASYTDFYIISIVTYPEQRKKAPLLSALLALSLLTRVGYQLSECTHRCLNC